MKLSNIAFYYTFIKLRDYKMYTVKYQINTNTRSQSLINDKIKFIIY